MNVLRLALRAMFTALVAAVGIIWSILSFDWRPAVGGLIVAGAIEGILAIERALRVDDPGCHQRRGSM